MSLAPIEDCVQDLWYQGASSGYFNSQHSDSSYLQKAWATCSIWCSSQN